MKKLIVTDKYNNKKLSKFILDSFPSLSSNMLYKALRQKDIKINGSRIHNDCIVNSNDEIQIYISDDFLFPSQKLDIIFEDENILLLNKPANLEVTGENSLTSIVHSVYKSCSFLPMPCHRLDRNTIGLVLFAKNQESLNILLEKFKKHEIEKSYIALVYGIPEEKTARLESYLFKDNKKSIVYISDNFKPGYQKIITNYSVLKEYSNNSSLLDINIETGKTHQIRAHLAYCGFPIIGDEKYGIHKINLQFNTFTQELQSYKIKFCLKAESSLSYLNNKTIFIP